MRGIRARLLSRYLLVLLCVLFISGLILSRQLESYFLHQLREDLAHRARLTAVLAERMPSDPAARDAFARQLELIAGTRVSIIAADGQVLADSLGQSSLMDDHSTRPEVSAALAGGLGWQTRASATAGYPMMYVAVIVPGADPPVVIRLALSLEQVLTRLGTVRAILWVGGAVCLVAASLLGLVLGRGIVQPLQRLAAAASRLARGDWDATADVRTGDELEDLADALNRMSQSVRANVHALSRQRDEQQAILDHLADGVLLLDPRGRIAHANRRARSLLGLATVAGLGPEALGRTPEVLGFVREALDQEEVSPRVLRTVYPQALVLHAHAVWIPAESGSRLLVTVQDITEISRLHGLRQELVANLSHELKTPVGAIKVLAETLEMAARDDPREAAGFVHRIVAESDRLAQMIGEMLLLSRIEAEQDLLRQEPVLLEAVLRQAHDEILPLAQRSRIEVQVEASGQPRVLGDADMLARAVKNLLDNAVKFSPAGSTVTARTFVRDDRAVIEVCDHGIGITQDQAARVFHRFYKAEPSRRTAGAGLGLAIVKHVVAAHSGQVFVRSRPNQGSLFGFELPLWSKDE